ncbi:hypothetical protein CUMW_152540 [Citrus unshiu]|uniref:Uncharacterized protein n=1 Tax=Citrus unshiu TaxID=55188 RepID=A0A2H5PNG6_CITUN|nr:hypothetical protein CUMW_152540 [Citrus unshiu]
MVVSLDISPISAKSAIFHRELRPLDRPVSCTPVPPSSFESSTSKFPIYYENGYGCRNDIVVFKLTVVFLSVGF